MKKEFIYTVISACLLVACNNYEQHPHQPVDSQRVETQKPLSQVEKDTARYVDFTKGETKAVLQGRLNEASEQVRVVVVADKGAMLQAVLVPEDSLVNIRFSKIIYPDGKTDGPFGREITVRLEEKGSVQLIISKNLMAEGSTASAFRVQLQKLR